MKIKLTKTWERKLDGSIALVKSQITKIASKEQPDKTVFDIEDVEKCVDKHQEALEYLQDKFCECGNLKADESEVCEECL